MQIDFSRTVHDRVDIPEDKILEAAIRVVEKKFGLNHQWIRNGKLYHEEHTSHSYDVCDGPASAEQLKANEVIKSLKEYLDA